MQKNVKDFFQYLVQSDPITDSLKLEDVIYSKSHRSEVCLVQLVGKNVFPIYTASEILNNKKLLNAFSRDDVVLIKELDMKILAREKRKMVLEINLNGTILLKDNWGRVKRYAEKIVSSDPEMIKTLSSLDAHSLGYRVGYRDGINEHNEITKIKSLKEKIKRIFPLSHLTRK